MALLCVNLAVWGLSVAMAWSGCRWFNPCAGASGCCLPCPSCSSVVAPLGKGWHPHLRHCLTMHSPLPAWGRTLAGRPGEGCKWMITFIKINLRITKAGGKGSTHCCASPTEEGSRLAAPCSTLTFFSEIFTRITELTMLEVFSNSLSFRAHRVQQS